ncbi:ATP-dependent_RNA helicase [Hexamita inflata]|uniref:RNA helicase n=1 Tax=Hexamita inflata TaxID=28002 RepID=A0ABP1HTQ7_9EUKA
MTEIQQEQIEVTWEKILVDGRIADVLRALDLQKPLPQQQLAIKALISQKDLLLSSKTGSGKTLSYLVPAIQHIIYQLTNSKSFQHNLKIIILEPTKELALQTHDLLKTLTRDLKYEIFHQVQLAGEEEEHKPKSKKQQDIDILITTPSQLLATNPKLDFLQMLVIDEADLMFAFNFKAQLEQLLKIIPSSVQKALCSATLSEDVDEFQKLMLKDPVKVCEQEQNVNKTSYSYFTYATELEKFSLLFTLYKLKIIQSRSLIFTTKLNESYKIKFFLEQFGLKPLHFAPSMPIEHRNAQIHKFNLSASDILIVCDESGVESGVIRGVDFENVSVVLNFSLPQTVEDLIHIAGRAGRGMNQPGLCINFVIDIDDDCQSGNLKSEFKIQNELLQNCVTKNIEFQYQEIEMDKVKENFGYRIRDVYNQMGEATIKTYRLEQLKNLVYENQQLRQHFQQHQKDKMLMQRKQQIKAKGLSQIPEYLKISAETIKTNCSLILEQNKVVQSHSYQKRGALLRKQAKK